MKPTVAISIGDPNGIGPEVVLKAVRNDEIQSLCTPVIFAPEEVLSWWQEKLGMNLPLTQVTSPARAEEGISLVRVDGEFDPGEMGRPTIGSGKISIRSIQAAFQSVYAGEASVLVTASISKEAIAMAGSPFKGHTDMLAHLCGADNEATMILTSDHLRVTPLTIHVPLREVAHSITLEKIKRTILTLESALKADFGIRDPHIAVLGLNPHAGDGGQIGKEELQIIAPAIAALQARGVRVEGPYPADGYFSGYSTARHDIVLAMYHDQGLVAFKMQAGGNGVNVTAGLPIVRTSPDHGTAYALAGRNTASPESMILAIKTALIIHTSRMRSAGSDVDD